MVIENLRYFISNKVDFSLIMYSVMRREIISFNIFIK